MPALNGDGHVSCPRCGALFVYHGRKPSDEDVERRCSVHNREDFTLDERASYAVYNGWNAYREYFDEEGERPRR